VAIIHYTIPDDLHRRVKASAAMAGMTQKDFLVRALERAVQSQRADEEDKGAKHPPSAVEAGADNHCY